MHHLVSRLRKAAVAAVAASLLAAPVPPVAASEPGTLVVATMWEALPLSMAPRRSRFFNESEILDTLIKLDYQMKLIPGLATSWERVNPTTWRFTLRDGVKFHDGSDFDAEAAKFSLERVIALLPYASDLLNIARMDAKGPLELEIETTEPFAALPNQLTDAITGIYARSSFDAEDKFVKPVGTGPWAFVDYQKQDRTIVERFDGYWGPAPSLEKVVYRYIPDHNSRALALETGEVDFVEHLLPSDVERLSRDAAFKVYVEPSAGLYYGAFNAGEKSVLKDARIRQALNLMVDRDILVKAALDGIGKPAWQFFPDDFPWVSETVTPYTLDLAAAEALLTEAGYAKTDGKWVKDGQPLTLRILSYSSRAEMSPITETLATLLQGQGVATQVQMFTWEGMLDLVKQGDYDVSVVFWTPEMTGHPDLHLKSQFHSKAGLNYQFWVNEEFDALVDKGRTLDAGADAMDTYARAQQILQTDAPIIPLVHKVFVAASSAALDGYRVHPSGFFYNFKEATKK
ncbi:ABC transporter substrate-binding protein [Polymorphum gilvum]|uniref:Oligopeptide ABC transporter, solute-binding protein n=1 Tax=Polymorphum gilvum (strain LMG 25793 / CGMCC 1.9160 / SL003B-26A1) TaxID=991905 RepID=F2J5V0_POLGS|nr:ABC transporter substrate-binding protein [Polymorphum gilvum]ADZ71204.1 Oligopeptide ABC transporter, solute-binding protein [Polymorphum gilvum SL003B-26A1]